MTSFPSNITRECAPCLLIVHGNAPPLVSQAFRVADARAAIRSKLPPYCQPNVFVHVVTSDIVFSPISGKLLRKQLPDYTERGAVEDHGGEEGTSEEEELSATEEVLSEMVRRLRAMLSYCSSTRIVG